MASSLEEPEKKAPDEERHDQGGEWEREPGRGGDGWENEETEYKRERRAPDDGGGGSGGGW
jgi:hypothetical protein